MQKLIVSPDHIQLHARAHTHGRSLLDERSAHCGPLYLHNTNTTHLYLHNTQNYAPVPAQHTTLHTCTYTIHNTTHL